LVGLLRPGCDTIQTRVPKRLVVGCKIVLTVLGRALPTPLPCPLVVGTIGAMTTSNDLSLLDRSADEIDLILGEELVADEFGAKDLTDVEKQATGRRWFASHLGEFRQALCGSSIRTKVFAPAKSDRNALFAAVVDTLAKAAGWPVPVAVLSAKLIHYGLDQLCEGGEPSSK
jgi:hypothetical protein